MFFVCPPPVRLVPILDYRFLGVVVSTLLQLLAADRIGAVVAATPVVVFVIFLLLILLILITRTLKRRIRGTIRPSLIGTMSRRVWVCVSVCMCVWIRVVHLRLRMDRKS